MDHSSSRDRRSGLQLQYLILLYIIFLQSFSGLVESYENYTVGDSFGWYDTLENPDVDYEKWASSKNFSLGDFLIFNTDNNHSVIQTYNFTTYKLCGYEDSTDNDTIQWSSANPSSTDPQKITVSVPLMKVGMTYFFSSDYDGEQCNYGQHFKISVTYGQGLPPDLKSPSDESPGPVSPESGDDEAAPDTIVPANFDNPRDTSTDDEKESSQSVSLFASSKFWEVKLYGAPFLVGILCLGYW
ncbi:early nodulin-like protein 18 [Primulina eburnea]|uniref:early nodulin-like protein 18 n=1 Tax=Primulina eburnea TaxID=1245227 RepID=UPI003C6C99B7